MSGDGSRSTDRRRLLKAIGGSTLALGLAGCSSQGGGDGTDDGDEPSGGGDDTTTETEATTTEAMDTTTKTTTADEGSGNDGGDSGGGDSGDGDDPPPADVSAVGSSDKYDWQAVSEREAVGTFDAPDDAPSTFGYTRINTDLTVSYGAMMGGETQKKGTVYVLFVVDGSVEGVVQWNTPIENQEEFDVSPDSGVVQMDASTITLMVFAWESPDGELFVMEREDFEF